MTFLLVERNLNTLQQLDEEIVDRNMDQEQWTSSMAQKSESKLPLAVEGAKREVVAHANKLVQQVEVLDKKRKLTEGQTRAVD